MGVAEYKITHSLSAIFTDSHSLLLLNLFLTFCARISPPPPLFSQ